MFIGTHRKPASGEPEPEPEDVRRPINLGVCPFCGHGEVTAVVEYRQGRPWWQVEALECANGCPLERFDDGHDGLRGTAPDGVAVEDEARRRWREDVALLHGMPPCGLCGIKPVIHMDSFGFSLVCDRCGRTSSNVHLARALYGWRMLAGAKPNEPERKSPVLIAAVDAGEGFGPLSAPDEKDGPFIAAWKDDDGYHEEMTADGVGYPQAALYMAEARRRWHMVRLADGSIVTSHRKPEIRDGMLHIEGLGGAILVPAASVAYIRGPIRDDL